MNVNAVHRYACLSFTQIFRGCTGNRGVIQLLSGTNIDKARRKQVSAPSFSWAEKKVQRERIF